MTRIATFILCVLFVAPLVAAEKEVLFDGTNMDALECREGAWVIDDSGALTCKMEEVKQKGGKTRTRGMGYLWTRKDYGDFELTLSYKLSEAANSGVFFRADKNDPVQGGFEIQLVDAEGFQKVKGKKDPKNLNGAFYDLQAASSDPANPVGQWNRLTLTCDGPTIQVAINDTQVINANVDNWKTPGKNPDGSANKFKTAMKNLPRTGRIGFQNHGQVVWFKNIVVRSLSP